MVRASGCSGVDFDNDLGVGGVRGTVMPLSLSYFLASNTFVSPVVTLSLFHLLLPSLMALLLRLRSCSWSLVCIITVVIDVNVAATVAVIAILSGFRMRSHG